MLRNTNVNTNPLPPLGIERFTISNYLIIISLLIAGNIVITETWSYSIVLITCLIIYQVNKWYKNLSEEEHTSNTLIIFILTLPLLATTIIYPLYFSAFKYYYEGTITPIRCYLSGCSFFSSLTEPLSMTKFNNNGFAALLLTFILILISSYILYKGIKLIIRKTKFNDLSKVNKILGVLLFLFYTSTISFLWFIMVELVVFTHMTTFSYSLYLEDFLITFAITTLYFSIIYIFKLLFTFMSSDLYIKHKKSRH